MSVPPAPTCAAPAGSAVALLQSAIDGDPLNFALLIQLLPQLLNDLQHSLSGAAQDVELPLVGEALDAGAGIDPDALAGADLVLAVQPLTAEQVRRLRDGATTVSFLPAAQDPGLVADLRDVGFDAGWLDQRNGTWTPAAPQSSR